MSAYEMLLILISQQDGARKDVPSSLDIGNGSKAIHARFIAFVSGAVPPWVIFIVWARITYFTFLINVVPQVNHPVFPLAIALRR